MKKLESLVIDKKIRSGKSDGTTKKGAYWNALEITIYQKGGPKSVTEESLRLELRHFRSGDVEAVACYRYFHLHDGQNIYNSFDCPELLACTAVEDVVAVLKGIPFWSSEIDADYLHSDLSKALIDFGLSESLPGPDEQIAV